MTTDDDRTRRSEQLLEELRSLTADYRRRRVEILRELHANHAELVQAGEMAAAHLVDQIIDEAQLIEGLEEGDPPRDLPEGL